MLIFNPTELLADAAAMGFSPSGNVKVMNNEFIKMKNEQIYITLYENECKYRVAYTFVNTGDEQTVVMGFPNYMLSSDHSESYGINDFSAFDGNSIYKIFRKYDESQRGHDMQELYECFEVHFNKGETKYITNTYSQEYTEQYGLGNKAVYILTTGASWKGTIDMITVFIDSAIPPNQLVERTAFFQSTEKTLFYPNGFSELLLSDRIIITPLNHFPGKYYLNQGVIKTVFRDIEPDFDIEIYKPDLLVSKLYASSELIDKNNRYAVKNIIDERPETAWVEGRKDSGINEYINIHFNTRVEVEPNNYEEGLLKIKKIGIINGYAKNNTIFKQNNRVKKIRLKGGSHDQIYTLKDTMDMQYIEFDEPILTSMIKITIFEVYKGSKYDDTCISEILVTVLLPELRALLSA
jgi:hypothetical protein